MKFTCTRPTGGHAGELHGCGGAAYGNGGSLSWESGEDGAKAPVRMGLSRAGADQVGDELIAGLGAVGGAVHAAILVHDHGAVRAIGWLGKDANAATTSTW
jgi:hypothetical protein